MKIETGYMPFKGFKTFYRVVGEKTDRAPLVLLHGGPGSTHNYFEVLDPLAELTHRQIVFYDQIGRSHSPSSVKTLSAKRTGIETPVRPHPAH